MTDPHDEKVTGPATAEGLAASVSRVVAKGPPPVHLWDPPFCGDLDIEIRADGSWHYMGTPIGRPAMVRLFASVLKREGARFYLVTPVEKIGIRVADAPFVAVDAEIGDDITFLTNAGDTVVAGPDNAIRIETAADGSPRPYVHVRRGLDALIDRKTFYRLVDAARPDAAGRLSLQSRGATFAFET